MLGTGFLGTRPLAGSPRLPRPFLPASVVGEYGWAAWSFSRQAKLNAWSWHGLGGADVYAWASLGNVVYVRKDADSYVHAVQPDTFFAAADTNTESSSVEATTQWMDFGKTGVLKALTGIDFDGLNVTTVEIYVAIAGDRDGSLAESVQIGQNDGGWTYNGEVIPLSSAGTEFKLRFIGDANQEVQVNRLTLYWQPLEG